MRAAFFNPDRAVEYLLTGIPEGVGQQQQQAPAAPRAASGQPAQTTPATGGTAGATEAAAPGGDEPVNLFDAAAQRGTGGGAGAGAGARTSAAAGAGAGGQGTAALDFLRDNPQFQQLRQVVQQQPQMLEPILQQVAAGNPQLAQAITQNPEQFMQLLAEEGGDDEALPPGAQQIAVTEEEREAIERVSPPRNVYCAMGAKLISIQLCRLGFDRDMVIQAYFACDKNEELAANFLFDQPDEPDDPTA